MSFGDAGGREKLRARAFCAALGACNLCCKELCARVIRVVTFAVEMENIFPGVFSII